MLMRKVTVKNRGRSSSLFILRHLRLVSTNRPAARLDDAFDDGSKGANFQQFFPPRGKKVILFLEDNGTTRFRFFSDKSPPVPILFEKPGTDGSKAIYKRITRGGRVGLSRTEATRFSGE